MPVSPRFFVRSYWGRITVVLVVLLAAAPSLFASWTTKRVYDDVVYFGVASPARIERFDLSTETWLDSITVTVSPQVLHVDASGIYLANQREVRHLNLDGSGEVPIFNATENIEHLTGDGALLFIMHPTYNDGRVSSLRVSDFQFVATWSSTYDFTAGFTIDPERQVLYGINTRTTAFDVNGVYYNEDGTFGTAVSGPWGNGSFDSSEAALHLSPDGRTLIRNNGIVYSAPSLNERGALAGVVEDAVFVGNDVFVVLRDGKLIAFTGSLLPAGVHEISDATKGIEILGDQIFAFQTDPVEASGISVSKIPFSDISAAQPGEPLNPALVPLVLDDVIPAGDDSFFLVDSTHQSILRWSATESGFTASLPLLDAPVSVAYSATADRLYLGYTSGSINQIKLDEGKTVEEPFAIRPDRILGLQLAGNLLFTVDNSGAWESFSTYDLDGTLLDTREWSNYSAEYIWAPNARRMFYFRDGSSPNDLLYSEIAEDGTIADDRDSPYHGDYSVRHPIRVSDDESGVLTGSGVIYSATDLTVVGSLPNVVTDGVSANNRWVTLRAASSDSQIQTWTANNLFDQGVTVPGEPLRLFELSDGRLLVFTLVNDRLVFSQVQLGTSPTVLSSPSLPTVSGSTSGYVGLPFEISVTAAGSGELSYQWYKNAAPLDGQTEPTLSIAEPTLDDVGVYMVVVSSAYGTIASDVFNLTFEDLPAPPAITFQPTSQTISPGSYFYGFSVYVNSAFSVTYQWRKDGAPIDGATNNSYNPTSNNIISAEHFGAYDVVVTDSFGRAVTSQVAFLSETTRTLGYFLLMDVPAEGATVTMVLRGGVNPTVVRVLGPSIPGEIPGSAMADPLLTIYDATGRLVALNDDWSTASNSSELATRAAGLGLPALVDGSTDAGLYRSLAPGSYTFHIEGSDGGTGFVWFEIYDAGSNGSLERFPYLAATARVSSGRPLGAGIVFNNAGRVPMLVRGWGPATERNGALADPAVTWADSSGVIRSNDNWDEDGDASSIAQYVSSRGFSSFAVNSRDAALFTPAIHASPVNVTSLVSLNESDGLGLLEIIQTDAFGDSSYNRVPPLVLIGPEPVQAVVGGDVVLSSRGTERTDYSYSWSRDGVPIVGAIGNTVLLRNVDADDVGNYAVTVSNYGASFTSMPVSINVISEAVDQAIVATHHATSFTAGGTATITVALSFPPEAASLGWSTELPVGWSYQSGSNEPEVAPTNGATGVLEWAWTGVPESPATFSFDVRVPVNFNDIATVRSFGFVQIDGRLIARLANPNPLILRPEHGYHRADTDLNGRIGLSELLRVIELYNYRESSVRTGRYSPAPDTVDGFQTGAAGGIISESFHSADYDRDGKVNLSELLRVIELYNFRSGTARTGEYSVSANSVDGFRAGP